MKRAFDLVISIVVLAFLLPILVITAIAVKCTSHGPVFYGANRAGKGGSPIRVWKFRTMGIDAEEKQKELGDRNQMSGPVFKIEKDPRVFRFGSFLPGQRRFFIGRVDLSAVFETFAAWGKKIPRQGSIPL